MSPEKEANERIVYAGLRRMSSDRATIQSAYSHWQSTLANKPFDIAEVVNLINNFLGLDTGERKRFMVAMHAATNKLVEELEPVPGFMQGGGQLEPTGQTGSTSNNTDQVVHQGSPHSQALKTFCTTFVKHVERANAADFREFTEACQEIDYADNNKVQKSMETFAKSSWAELVLPEDISLSECQDVVSALYTLSTEFVGPMAADQLQTKTIEGMLTMDFATQFDPRKLA